MSKITSKNKTITIKVDSELENKIEARLSNENKTLEEKGLEQIDRSKLIRRFIEEALVEDKIAIPGDLKFSYFYENVHTNEKLEPCIVTLKGSIKLLLVYTSVCFSNPAYNIDQSEVINLERSDFEFFNKAYFKNNKLDESDNITCGFNFYIYEIDNKDFYVYECVDVFKENRLIMTLKRGGFKSQGQLRSIDHINKKYPYLRSYHIKDLLNKLDNGEIIKDLNDKKLLRYDNL